LASEQGSHPHTHHPRRVSPAAQPPPTRHLIPEATQTNHSFIANRVTFLAPPTFKAATAMKLTSWTLCAAVALENNASAFVPPQRFRWKTSLEYSIKESGAGISTVPPGGLTLFDPNTDGKLQGTNNLLDRITKGAAYELAPPQISVDSPPPGVTVEDAQCFLEHLDANGDVPVNFAKPQAPVTATVLGRAKLITDDAPGDIEHVIMRLPVGFNYVEGQSLSVIPPGIDPKTGRNHKPRLYSIASTRYGDLLDGSTISLCVRRAEYIDPNTGEKDPAKQGVCSKFLCEVSPGDEVSVAGPVGKTMLLPDDPTKDVVMIATGTGIAPFRGFYSFFHSCSGVNLINSSNTTSGIYYILYKL
jgi:hypothetical protein